MVDWIWPLSALGQNSNLNWIFKSRSRSRSRPFPGIPASHSRSQKSGRQFSFPFPFPNIGNAIFIPVPIPKSWECNFSFPFPFPKFGNGLSYSRSRSQSPKSHSRSPLNSNTICWLWKTSIFLDLYSLSKRKVLIFDWTFFTSVLLTERWKQEPCFCFLDTRVRLSKQQKSQPTRDEKVENFRIGWWLKIRSRETE